MTLIDIEELLPNGFHDAEIEELVWDYRENSASFTMQFWVPEETDENPEIYRRGRLVLNGIVFIIIDPPCPRELDPPYKPSNGTLQIDGLQTTESLLPTLVTLRQTVSPDVSPYSFYVDNWNSYIHIAAKEANLAWIGEREIRGKK